VAQKRLTRLAISRHSSPHRCRGGQRWRARARPCGRSGL